MLMASVTSKPAAAPGVAERSAASSLVIRIEPPRGWFDLRLRELWDYRELLYFFVWRDVKIRYKQTAIGVLRVVLQPLLTMLVFTLFFGKLAKLPSQGCRIRSFILRPSFRGCISNVFLLFVGECDEYRGGKSAGHFRVHRLPGRKERELRRSLPCTGFVDKGHRGPQNGKCLVFRPLCPDGGTGRRASFRS
jgi:hypothetical protein